MSGNLIPTMIGETTMRIFEKDFENWSSNKGYV